MTGKELEPINISTTMLDLGYSKKANHFPATVLKAKYGLWVTAAIFRLLLLSDRHNNVKNCRVDPDGGKSYELDTGQQHV